jgi:hypothetical protein
MIPVEQQKDPRNDIGPVYKGMAGLGLAAAFIILGIQAIKGHHVGLHDILLIAIAALLCLGLWRPDGFDMVIKEIAHALPSIPFTKREVSQQETDERPAVQPNGE